MISSIGLSLLTLLTCGAGSFSAGTIMYFRSGERLSDGRHYDLHLQIHLVGDVANLHISEDDFEKYINFHRSEEAEIHWDNKALETIARLIIQINNIGDYSLSINNTAPEILPLGKGKG